MTEPTLRDETVVASVVVVLSYKGRGDTLRCVESLVDHAPGHTVLVVDNGSGDGVLEAVGQRWSQVATLQTGSNLGFAGGMNRGLEWAWAHGASTVTVLNNDTEVAPGALDALVARASSGLVAVSPVVRYQDRDGVWFEGGRQDDDDRLPRHLTSAEASVLRSSADPAAPYGSDLLAGCCITASATTWHTAGSFDERYFLNFEDSEWSLRARAAGVRLEVLPAATVRHRVSASFVGTYSYLGTFYYARNCLLFARTAGIGPRGRLRLLRHRVLSGLTRTARTEGPAEGARRALVVGVALGCEAFRCYGRAPGWLESLAARWARGAGGR